MISIAWGRRTPLGLIPTRIWKQAQTTDKSRAGAVACIPYTNEDGFFLPTRQNHELIRERKKGERK